MSGHGDILPAEVLFECFSNLDFLDRCRVALVNRYWRACALGSGLLWRHVDLTVIRNDGLKADVLLAALARSNDLAIDVLCNRVEDGRQRELATVMCRHMHRFRGITWEGNVGHELWTVAAPALQFLMFCGDAPVTMSADFLAGDPGQLKTLLVRCFVPPKYCPALQGVTKLAMSARDSDELPEELYSVFPCLAKLCLSRVPDDAQRLSMPRGPAPRSLKTVTLSTTSITCNLFERVHATPAPYVRLDMPLDCMSLGVHDALGDAVELMVGHVTRSGRVADTARVHLRSGRVLFVVFQESARGVDPEHCWDRFISGLVGTPDLCLRLLESITMPLRALTSTLGRTHIVMPALRSIRALVDPYQHGWRDLCCLMIESLRPGVSLVTIDVRNAYGLQATREDAEVIIDCIARFGGRGMGTAEYVLCGFQMNGSRMVSARHDGDKAILVLFK